MFSQSWYGTAPASDKCAVAALERTACKRAHKILAKKRQAEGNEEHKILGREEKRRERRGEKRRGEKSRAEKEEKRREEKRRERCSSILAGQRQCASSTTEGRLKHSVYMDPGTTQAQVKDTVAGQHVDQPPTPFGGSSRVAPHVDLSPTPFGDSSRATTNFTAPRTC